MPFFEAPTAYRLRNVLSDITSRQLPRAMPDNDQSVMLSMALNTTMDFVVNKAHSSHPDFIHLAGLVCEAVLEVVFVALPGFIVAYSGMFDANSQKFVAELNTMVFTPCLIFTKLASQLSADKLAELAVIPIIFVIQTGVSWLAAQMMARAFGFGRRKRQKNFILAMGVFGNSNSLPISLVISLSKTISGLHWDQRPGDNDDEVAARGILYLLIFQQLGQLLRWTWGYSVLLKPAAAYEEEERRLHAENVGSIEEGPYRDEPDSDDEQVNGLHKPQDSGFSSSPSSISEEEEPDNTLIPATPANGNNITTSPRNLSPNARGRGKDAMARNRNSVGHITQFPDFLTTSSSRGRSQSHTAIRQRWESFKARANAKSLQISNSVSERSTKVFHSLPQPVQKFLSRVWQYFSAFMRGVWRQMNPPLWAMLAALIVASIPALQKLFFHKGTFVNNSITRAVSQTGNVAVPLILVVLGANLARNALPQDQLATTPEEKKEERKLLYASLLSRMVIPTVIMAPVLALFAKFVPVSILDDPIFVIVAFLLTGAPSALQLAQICQMNEVFMGAMSSLLVASYVVAILPSTLILVLLALEVVEWAA